MGPCADDLTASRFFVDTDHHTDALILPLPRTWWSRPYEYAWAGEFAAPGAVVLDAACGISHPFKFWLARRGSIVHACDIDPRIASRQAILEDVVTDFGPGMTEPVATLLDQVHRCRCSLDRLPYASGTFDVVFCLSVLEHLADVGNSHFGLAPFIRLLPGPRFRRRDIDVALSEFARVVKPEGLIVLTFDHPIIDLRYLERTLKAHGLNFVGAYDSKLPAGALASAELGLTCFRAVVARTGVARST